MQLEGSPMALANGPLIPLNGCGRDTNKSTYCGLGFSVSKEQP